MHIQSSQYFSREHAWESEILAPIYAIFFFQTIKRPDIVLITVAGQTAVRQHCLEYGALAATGLPMDPGQLILPSCALVFLCIKSMYIDLLHALRSVISKRYETQAVLWSQIHYSLGWALSWWLGRPAPCLWRMGNFSFQGWHFSRSLNPCESIYNIHI